MKCCRCEIDLIGTSIICKTCFSDFISTKGKTFTEFCNKPYDPEPKVIPPGVGTAEDAPPE
jgi:hypothetical protein